MNQRMTAGLSSTLLLALGTLGGCGLPPGTEITLDLLGTWVNSTTVTQSALEYRIDGTFRLTAIVGPVPDGAHKGCTARRVTSGRYTTDASERTITQSGAMAVVSNSGCADPSRDSAERALPAADAAAHNRSFSYTLSGNTLRLSVETGGGVTYTRQ